MFRELLVTGSSGLIGSEVVNYFCRLGWQVYGVDNNMRADFFGPAGDTRGNQRRLQGVHKSFIHHELDIRNRPAVLKCNVEGRCYKVFGYKGKQVRDNIHSRDVARFIHAFVENPRSGEVYNIGGGRGNSISILEAFDRAAAVSGKKVQYEYVD